MHRLSLYLFLCNKFVILFFYDLPFSHGFDFYDVTRMKFSSFSGFDDAVGFDEAVF